jgi:LacI family transcriptional regulator
MLKIDNVVKEQRQVARGGHLVTLKQVAEKAGVSIKTVSRIVNGDSAVNAGTRASVMKHLNRLNYVPNQAARQMRSGASSVFGLMTDAIATTPYSVDIVRGAQSALKDGHQTLLIANSDGDPEQEKQLWRMFRAHRVAGVIYAAMFHRAHDIGKPSFGNSVVLANCYAAEGDRAAIIPDDEQGGYSQARYLLERGHRNIGIISLIKDIDATRLRSIGIRRAFQESGLSLPPDMEQAGYVGEVRREVSIVRDVAKRMLSRSRRPTAVICGNDTVAMQVYSVAAEQGLSIPQDLSLIGFDDLKLISESLYPKLTTVALPYYEIGQRAVELMKAKQVAGRKRLGRMLVPCPLVERQSCRMLA